MPLLTLEEDSSAEGAIAQSRERHFRVGNNEPHY